MKISSSGIVNNLYFLLILLGLSSCTKNVSMTRLMPAEINVPNQVQRYETDAVLTLEKFSSDFVITDKKNTIKKKIGKEEDSKTMEVPGLGNRLVQILAIAFSGLNLKYGLQ